MTCNPLRWLWGLLPLTLVWWVGLLATQSRVEEELTERANRHLESTGLGWAKASFKARNAVLSGRAEEESDKARPGIEVAKLWGVRAIEDQIEVLQLIKDYRWIATARDGVLSLSGYVPNEAARKAILASARSAFPSHKVEDKTDFARGAPEQKQWLGGTAFALRQLAALKPGGRVALEAAGLVIEGEAESSKSYESVRGALSRSMPQGISLKTERIVPPLVKPYTWSAALRGRQLELTGYAPSVQARDHVKAVAERAMSGGTVLDRMTLGSGAPADWQKAADLAIARLVQLKQGTADLRDAQLAVRGLTDTEPAAEAVRAALKREVPSAFSLIEEIRQDPVAKAAEEARRAAERAAKRAAAEAEARRIAAAEDEARRAAEERRRRAEEEARRAAEARNLSDEEARRGAAEEARRAAEAKTRAEDEARRRAEEEARRTAEARARAEDDARRAAEARAKAEAERLAAAARAKAEEDARRAAEAQRQQAAAVQARTAEGQRCQQALAAAVEAGTITFQRASAELDRRSHQTLNALAQIVKGCPGYVIEVGGHTDNEGEPDRNQRLSERRATSVLEYLVKAGVAANALTSVGYGETQPKLPNEGPDGRPLSANMAKNRRIEFVVKMR